MPALIFLFGLFLYGYAEISLLVVVGSHIGVFPLILLMIAISAFGLWMTKLRGIITIVQIRNELAQGKMPTQAVISSLFFAIAGILLVIPGFISDILAILLMLPITRKLLQLLLVKYFAHRVKIVGFGGFQSQQHHSETTFEAEFERKQDEDKWLK